MIEQQATETRPQHFAKLFREQYDYDAPRRGEVREVTVLSIGDRDLLVDLGVKQDGIVPPQDLDMVDEEYLRDLQVGDRIPVTILSTRGSERVVVSLNKGLQEQDWLRAQDLVKSGEVFEAEVLEANSGGVVVPFGRARGFVPNSHLTSVPRGVDRNSLNEAKQDLIGETVSLVAIEVDPRRRRLILSQRMANGRLRQRLLKELETGQVLTGVVSSIVDFGAFVDLGGVDGLVHISELDHRHVNHPSEVLEAGEEVQIKVLSVDLERKRIALSRKRLLPDPWEAVAKNLQVGQEVEGPVANVTDFGAFVDLGGGFEGLIHVSDMPDGHLNLPELEGGGRVLVQVLNIDQMRRQVSLKLLKVLEDSASEDDSAAAE